ncbi:MAG: GNAT family N-acetyltransferase, partial [Christensenellales bacterium]
MTTHTAKVTVRPAQQGDLDAIMAIYASARKYMAANGNPTQWGNGYPARELLESDIEKHQLYVC